MKKNILLNAISDRFIWDNLKKQVFISMLEVDSCARLFDDFVKFDFQTDQCRVNLASKQLCDVLVFAPEPILKRRAKGCRPRNFDIDCVRTSKKLRKLGRLVSTDHKDRILRQKFYKMKKT